jgi:hypothetical protein
MDLCDAANQKVLFVGEGNFSFSLAMAKMSAQRPFSWTSTCFESAPVSEIGASNTAELSELGIRVCFGVDATNLEKYFSDECDLFDRVVFMFPHVGGKMKIQNNRRLLREFGASAARVVEPERGRVVVTLCAGQGGSDFDVVQRSGGEADTWQIVKMMADSGLLMVRAGPVDLATMKGYVSYGYRSLDKGFHTERAVGHTFALKPCPLLDWTEERDDVASSKLKALKCSSSKVSKLIQGLMGGVQGECIILESLQNTECVLKLIAPKVLLHFDDTVRLGNNPFTILLLLDQSLQQEDIVLVAESEKYVLLDATAHLLKQCETSWKELWTESDPYVSPETYSYDLSFWAESRVDIKSLQKLLWRVGGADFIEAFEVVDDAFVRDGRKSYTVRLVYRAFAFAMGPETAFRLHRDYLGKIIEQEFGAELR